MKGYIWTVGAALAVVIMFAGFMHKNVHPTVPAPAPVVIEQPVQQEPVTVPAPKPKKPVHKKRPVRKTVQLAPVEQAECSIVFPWGTIKQYTGECLISGLL